MPSLHSGQETAQTNPSLSVEREKNQREVDRGGGRGQPVGLPLACSSLLGLPWCWVQSSQLSKELVCAHGCAIGTVSHRSRLCSTEGAKGQKVGPACPVTRRTLIMARTLNANMHTPKIPFWFTHTNSGTVYMLWRELLSKCTGVFQLLVFKLVVMIVLQSNTRTKSFLLFVAAD